MKPDNKEIREVAARAGTTVYFINKWLANGDIPDTSFETVQAYMRKLALAKLGMIDRATALFYLDHDANRFNDLLSCGAILPLANGMFYGMDLYDPQPHKFALLPARPDYTPTRPNPNLPIERRAKGIIFDRAFENRCKACPEWQRNGYKQMYIADGFWCEARFTNPIDYWQDTYAAAPTRGGDTTRIYIYAWADKTKTICNLGLVDEYGVMARAHGIYNRARAWHEALYRAVLALGLSVSMAADLDAEIARLQDWLNGQK